jgi:hypothetical protein
METVQIQITILIVAPWITSFLDNPQNHLLENLMLALYEQNHTPSTLMCQWLVSWTDIKENTYTTWNIIKALRTWKHFFFLFCCQRFITSFLDNPRNHLLENLMLVLYEQNHTPSTLMSQWLKERNQFVFEWKNKAWTKLYAIILKPG